MASKGASRSSTSFMLWLLVVLVALAGALSPAQAGLNARLRELLGSSAEVAIVNGIVGALPLVLYLVVRGLTVPGADAVRDTPWYVWTGGLIGSYFIIVTLLSAERLGAALLVTVLVAGQAVGGLVLDHFGLLGYEVKPVTLWRLAGVLLVVAGVVLLQRS